MAEAWLVYDRWYDDDRVTFVREPAGVEDAFRETALKRTVSPKVWADAWLLAFSRTAGGKLVTFDKALATHGALCLLAM